MADERISLLAAALGFDSRSLSLPLLRIQIRTPPARTLSRERGHLPLLKRATGTPHPIRCAPESGCASHIGRREAAAPRAPQSRERQLKKQETCNQSTERWLRRHLSACAYRIEASRHVRQSEQSRRGCHPRMADRTHALPRTVRWEAKVQTASRLNPRRGLPAVAPPPRGGLSGESPGKSAFCLFGAAERIAAWRRRVRAVLAEVERR